jgi:hypothetical protein
MILQVGLLFIIINVPVLYLFTITLTIILSVCQKTKHTICWGLSTNWIITPSKCVLFYGITAWAHMFKKNTMYYNCLYIWWHAFSYNGTHLCLTTHSNIYAAFHFCKSIFLLVCLPLKIQLFILRLFNKGIKIIDYCIWFACIAY